MSVLIRLVPALAASVALAAAAGAAHTEAAGPALLPDLDQETPAKLVVTQAGSEYRLGFRSAVRNVGDGPLIILGARHDRGVDTMVADQAIARRGSPQQVLDGVGRLRYVVSPDHRHWHLLGFERYELRRPGGGVALVRDRKTGFCLGDRYEAGDGALAPKRYRSRCGLGQPRLLGITQGISVGYGDAYGANLEGQYLPLAGLPEGRYLLVHRVNVDRRIRERSYANNAASVLLDLRWRAGIPHLAVIAACPDSARCATR